MSRPDIPNPGDTVTDGRRRGEFIRFETRHRQRWAIVRWDGRLYTDREYPHNVVKVRVDA